MEAFSIITARCSSIRHAYFSIMQPYLHCAKLNFSLTGNYIFPSWEHYIPRLRTKHSLRGNLRQVTSFAVTFPANRHSPPSCRLDTSLLSTTQQGAERRSARKVTEWTPCDSLFFQFLTLFFGRFPKIITIFAKNTTHNARHLRKIAYLCEIKL